MTARAITAGVAIGLFVVLAACILLIDGVGRNAFVGEASVSIGSVTYIIAPRIFCAAVVAVTFVLAVITHRLVRRRR